MQCPSDSCNLNDKPNVTRPCFNPDCSAWVTGNWGECAVSCGEGVQTRQVYCSDDDESLCSELEMPESTRDCFVSQCGAWIITRWGPCSAKCGLGYTTRNATCIYPDSQNCTNRPAIVKLCDEAHCTKWSTGRWSPCSVTCGRGSQRRIVSCQGGQCDASSKPLSTKDCVMPSCSQWVAGNWSECSSTCGDGVQIRYVRCSDIDPKRCTDSKPVIKRYCKKRECPYWSIGAWERCSVSCGNGTQTRNVTCIDGSCSNSTKPVEYRPCYSGKCPVWMVGEWTPCSSSCGNGYQIRIVYCNGKSDSSCDTLVKPRSAKRCNKLACPQWNAGSWSVCSKSCDGGIQSRNVSCTNSHVGECAEKSKPSTTQKCSELPCPRWTVGLWSKCSKSCDGGIQSRIVSCNNSHVGACPESSKPATSQECGQVPCPEWSVGQWSKCSKSCDGGTQTRTVACNNSHIGDCSVKHKPGSARKCGDVPCPEWSVGVWSKCSKSCGGGIKNRTVSCENNHVGKCNLETKPESMVPCRDIPCPQWIVGEWSPCSKSCNGGVQSRSVNCNNSHIGECLMKDKPPMNQSCGSLPCPQWRVSSWKKCSKSCGGGVKFRAVFCTNRHVGDCLVAEKPRGVKRCRKVACPSWMVGEWSGCSKTCGGGILIRNVSCKNDHIGSCDRENKPVDRQECGKVPCPHWSVGQWSECSKSCDGGLKTRAVTCENGHIGICPPNERPSTNEECGVVPCPKWSVGEWSQCSQSCGGGTQTRNVTCLNDHVGDCPVDEKPTAKQLCGNAPCPYWKVGMWSECSKSCDGGFQIRSVICKNSHVGDCLVDEKPTTNQTCGEIPCPKWAVGNWSKCSKSCGGGVKRRTVSCENNHVGECLQMEKPQGTKSCRDVPCPEWYVGEWSKCSKSCDGGIQTRTVSCQNDHVGECLVSDRPESIRQCGELPCPKWSISEWSQCSKSCDGGIRVRIVTCENRHVGACLAKDKPNTNETCANEPCPVWSIGEWSRCSKSCDGGVQTRIVTCNNSYVGECVVADRPDRTQTCGNAPCPKWSITEWSPCSKSCNGGVQTRNVTCRNSHVGDCILGDRPDDFKTCSNVPCPEWSAGIWSACSKSCNGGTQRRSVICNNSHVGECLPNDKPISSKNCADVPCPEWSVGQWSKCSKSCGSGIQRRTVFCNNSNVGACIESQKPETTNSCGELPCPEWSVGQWSSCSKSCSNGTQTRTVICENNHVGPCIQSQKPASNKSCGELPCPEWSAGQWSSCSTSCGGGIQTRSVICENSHVGDCLVTYKPSGTRKCSEVPCPKWSVGEWSECSKSCNTGVKTRTVTCKNSHIGPCLLKNKPEKTMQCSEVPCPEWSVDQWSKCSKSCGGGTQFRTVTCRNSHVGKCQESDKPNNNQNCSEIPCPEWSVGQWSKCSKSCGGGIMTRSITCKNSHGGKCPGEDKPTTNQKCSEVPCPEWSVGQWSKCSKSCDGGTQTRTVTCKNNHVGKCLKADQPATNQKCSEVPCPEWTVGQWSKCSKSCDGGMQTRTVTCKNRHVGECPVESKPLSKQNCGELSCPKWSVGNWSECSKSCGSGKRTRTVQCTGSSSLSCQSTKPASHEICNDVACPKWIVGNWTACKPIKGRKCPKGRRFRTVECSWEDRRVCNQKTRPVRQERCAAECPKWKTSEWSQVS